MGTKTIGLREDAYERLKARKRADESFTDLVERLLDEATADWREGFGTLSTAEADELEQIVAGARAQTGAGLAKRQQDALDELSAVDDR
jgi:predicted CopG family antitoxin